MTDKYDKVAFNEMTKATSSEADRIIETNTKPSDRDIDLAKMFTTADSRLLRKMQMRGEPRDVLRSEKRRGFMDVISGATMYITDYAKTGGYSKEEKNIASEALGRIREQIYPESREKYDILLENYMKHFNTNFAHKQSAPDPYYPLKDFVEKNISYEPLRWPQDSY